VRELRNAMEQAALSAGPDPVLGPADLALPPPRPLPAAPATAAAGASPTLPQMERETLVQTLARTGGNVSRAARLLGISRDTMRYRIAKHGLEGTVAGVEGE
jgi:DNA-binding NtrC family response regulator